MGVDCGLRHFLKQPFAKTLLCRVSSLKELGRGVVLEMVLPSLPLGSRTPNEPYLPSDGQNEQPQPNL